MRILGLMLFAMLSPWAWDRDAIGATAVDLRLVAEGLVQPVALAAPPNDPRRFVVEQIGRIRIIDGSGKLLEQPFLDIRNRLVELKGFDERGMLGLAFGRNFATSGRFYVYYSAPAAKEAPKGIDHRGRVSAFQVSTGNPDRADPASERVVLEVDEHRPIHNGGALAFGPEGMLYVALGDSGTYPGGPGEGRKSYSQDPDKLLGKILRIDVSELPYRIPEDNPFVDRAGFRPEIFALGLRNPYRCSFDSGGEFGLLCGDVGRGGYEEVNRIKAGANYGWRIKEGRHCFDGRHPLEHPQRCAGDELTPPVLEYVNCSLADDCHGRAVIGGYIYRGTSIPRLQGSYVFGDWAAKVHNLAPSLYVAQPREDGSGRWPFAPLEVEWPETKTCVLGFGEDAERELYLLGSSEAGPKSGHAGGRVYRFAPRSIVPATRGPSSSPGSDEALTLSKSESGK